MLAQSAKTHVRHTSSIKAQYNGAVRTPVTEPPMTARLFSLLLAATLLVVCANAKDKDKKKPSLPEYVLRASTVLVVVSPDAGEPLERPTANADARDNVEKALMEWGRLHPVMDGADPDLVIAVRTGAGKMVQPSIKGGPIDNRAGVGAIHRQHHSNRCTTRSAPSAQ